MALPSSGPISLQAIQQEFGGTPPASMLEYYRKGPTVLGPGNVPNISYNQNIPVGTGLPAISFENFYGARSIRSDTYDVPAYSTTTFNSSDGNRSYRKLAEFDITENKRFYFDFKLEIMGDERESNTFTSTNRMLVKNPRISIYVGGTVTNNATAPTGTEVAYVETTASSNNDDGRVATQMTLEMNVSDLGDPLVYAPVGKIYVVGSMVCQTQGGPDAPLARWWSPAFTITAETG